MPGDDEPIGLDLVIDTFGAELEDAATELLEISAEANRRGVGRWYLDQLEAFRKRLVELHRAWEERQEG